MDPAVRAFDATRDLDGKPFRSLCYAPYVQLSFSPNGDVSACCISRSNVLGNIRTERLDEIWNGERLRKFRRALRHYAFPHGCESCQWSLAAGNYADHPIRPFDLLPVSDEAEWPVKLEFALSNTCNLGCIMCSGEYSSVLRAKEGLPPMPRSYDDQFFEDLARYLPHTQWLSFLGGEPFLQKECHRIWDLLIDMDLAIPCHVTTNGSVYNAKVERYLQHLPFNFNISVDGVTKETVESIRVNVKFESLMENIRRFAEYAGGSSDRHAAKRIPHLQVNYCVMQQNWQEVADFFLYAEELGAEVWTVLVTHPPRCSLLTLAPERLQQIVNALEARSDELRKVLRRNWNGWTAMVAELRSHLGEGRESLDRLLEAGVRGSAAAPGTKRLRRAWQLRVEGRLDEALRECEIPSAADREFAFRARCLRGDVKIDLGDLSGAEAELNEAVGLAAKRPEAHLIRAWLRVVQGEMGGAVEESRKAARVGCRLREAEARIITDVLVKRLVAYEPLEAVLSRSFPSQPEDSAARVPGTGVRAARPVG